MPLRPHPPAWLLAPLLLELYLCLGRAQEVIPGTVHTIFSTECTPYFTFQTMTLAYTHKRVGQPGNLTRIMSCDDEQWKEFNKAEMDIVQTHRTPQFADNPENGDSYSPYNKPCGVMHWLENVRPQEEWILVVDSDIIFRQTFLPEELKIEEGWALAAYYNYMKGGNNQMAMTHIPTVEPRNDTYGGSENRRADEVGAFYFLRTKDLIKVAPLWKKYTEDVRFDPLAWKYSGDSFAKEGEKPWISEMYGWVYGMAKLDIKHVIDPTMQLYAGYYAPDIPRLIHYGLTHTVLKYRYDKHDHLNFNSFACPPWDLSSKRAREKDGGLFPHPPYPHELPDKEMHDQYGQLMTIEFVNTINKALCERHRSACPNSSQLEEECGRVDRIEKELEEKFREYDPQMCADNPLINCVEKSQQGMCVSKWIEMNSICRATCGLCRKDVPWGNEQSTMSNLTGISTNGMNGFATNEIGESTSVSHLRYHSQGPFLKEKQMDLFSKALELPHIEVASVRSGADEINVEHVDPVPSLKSSAIEPSASWIMIGIIGLIAVGYYYCLRQDKMAKNEEKDCKV